MPTQNNIQEDEEIHIGDKVQGIFEDQETGRQIVYTGIITLIVETTLYVQRDDGREGGGHNGEWICNKAFDDAGNLYWGANAYDGRLTKLESEKHENLVIRKSQTKSKHRVNSDIYKKAIKLTQISF